MRLALLCDDAAVIPWLETLASDADHELTLAVTVTPAATELLRGRSGIRLTPHWQDLLAAAEFDAVLAGGDDPRILEAIRQLAAAGQTLLLLPNIGQGSTFIYELSLIRDDNRVPIHPAVWHRCDPLLSEVRERLRAGSAGRIQLLQVHREIPAAAQTSLLSRCAVDAALLEDVDLLRWFGGDYDQVTALRTGATEQGLLTQSVKLSGRDLSEATWEARVGKTPARTLTIQTDRETIVLSQEPPAGEWTLRQSASSNVGSQRSAVRNYLNRLQAGSAMPGEWHELVKAYETVDATQRSVARRRTIELHFEPMSERAIFKTQMTAIGCGVLFATLLLVLLYLAVASLVPLPSSVLTVVRLLIFAPLAVYLLLQVLYPLTRPSESHGDPV